MNVPAIGICGWSGAGKTTLIEQLLPRLTARGLAVAVLKHDAHGLQVDRAGKDTDRFFCAGAVRVCAYDDEQVFLRSPEGRDLETALSLASAGADLVLVEGLKNAPLPKIWLRHPDRRDTDEPSASGDPSIPGLLAVLEPGPDRADRTESLILQWLEEQWRSREQWVGILIGGVSKRMGAAKHLLRLGDRTILEALFEQACGVCPNVAFLGTASLPPALYEAAPQIPDVTSCASPQRTEKPAGPLAAVLAAMRWNRTAAWTFIACDLPKMNAGFLEWLQNQRRPGVWAVLPQRPGHERIEPLAALYEPYMRAGFESLAASGDFALNPIRNSSKASILHPPSDLIPCLDNANTPEEWRAAT